MTNNNHNKYANHLLLGEMILKKGDVEQHKWGVSAMAEGGMGHLRRVIWTNLTEKLTLQQNTGNKGRS